MQTGRIKYIDRHELNEVAWERCLSSAANKLIYCHSWYLDCMAPNWSALVMEDYEVIMPLPWKKKFGFFYIYQPFLTAQLGLFGRQTSKAIVQEFVSSIPRKFKLAEISLNAANEWSGLQRTNYILDLRSDYETIYSKYSENLKRNLRKSADINNRINKNTDVEVVIAMAAAQMKAKGCNPGDNMQLFRNLFTVIEKKANTAVYSVADSSGNLLASAVFFIETDRAYYILVGNATNGKNSGASHSLIDAFIKDHAGEEILLDFEGSDIPGLALFYSSFGARDEKYPWLGINRLPIPFKWFKRGY